jgi:ABC-type multidrug transport system ATPase subunit
MPTSPATEHVVTLDRVTRLYGNFAALRDVSLTLSAGSSVVLLGENGAGKSTLLKLIAGLATPSYGAVNVFGERPLAVRDHLAYMSHATMLYDELTGLENLEYFASLNPGPHTLNPTAALREVGLDPALPRRVADYSQGMKQRASLARVLLSSPDLLLLDEPFSNLDVASAQAMITRLHTYLATPGTNNQPRTLILTTHQHELAKPLATRTLTLEQGQIASDL